MNISHEKSTVVGSNDLLMILASSSLWSSSLVTVVKRSRKVSTCIRTLHRYIVGVGRATSTVIEATGTDVCIAR